MSGSREPCHFCVFCIKGRLVRKGFFYSNIFSLSLSKKYSYQPTDLITGQLISLVWLAVLSY